MKVHLESLADGIMALFPPESNVTLRKRIADFDLRSDTLFLIGLITNELLTDVMRYAFANRAGGLITLVLERSGSRARLIVENNGVGLPPGFDPTATDGFGRTLVRMLSEQLGGSFSVSTRSGTRCVLQIAL